MGVFPLLYYQHAKVFDKQIFLGALFPNYFHGFEISKIQHFLILICKRKIFGGHWVHIWLFFGTVESKVPRNGLINWTTFLTNILKNIICHLFSGESHQVVKITLTYCRSSLFQRGNVPFCPSPMQSRNFDCYYFYLVGYRYRYSFRTYGNRFIFDFSSLWIQTWIRTRNVLNFISKQQNVWRLLLFYDKIVVLVTERCTLAQKVNEIKV